MRNAVWSLASAEMTGSARSAKANFSSLLTAKPVPLMMPLVRMSPSTALKCAGWPSSAKSPLIAATAPMLAAMDEGVAWEVITGPLIPGSTVKPDFFGLGENSSTRISTGPSAYRTAVSVRPERGCQVCLARAAITVAWTEAGNTLAAVTAEPARRARAAPRASRRLGGRADIGGDTSGGFSTTRESRRLARND
jgi:hypothetical protein